MVKPKIGLVVSGGPELRALALRNKYNDPSAPKIGQAAFLELWGWTPVLYIVAEDASPEHIRRTWEGALDKHNIATCFYGPGEEGEGGVVGVVEDIRSKRVFKDRQEMANYLTNRRYPFIKFG